jgi:hypothetical protein
MALTSPGVQVSVIDESFYTPAEPGTTPIIFVATEQNKLNGSGTGIAPGTLAENAGKVYLVTSQRDLVETFGDPKFVTDTNGNVVQGGEQNEYGLQAAYSYLGVSNSAYVVRAGVDLGALNASSSATTANPEDGTWWLDTQLSKYGIFEWDGAAVTTDTGQTFVSKTPRIITSVSELSDSADATSAPNTGIGAKGEYAIVATTSTIKLYYKNNDNAWVIVGSEAWVESIPSVTGTNTVSNTSFSTGSTFVINPTGASAESTEISFSTGSATLTEVVGDINTAMSGTGVSAEIRDNKLVILNDGSTSDVIQIVDGVNQPLSTAGITEGFYYAPKLQISKHTDVPAYKSGDTNPRPTGSVWLKTTSPNAGADWKIKQFNADTALWGAVDAPIYASNASAIYNLDRSGGGANLSAGDVFVQSNAAEDSDPLGQFKPFVRRSSGATTVTSNKVTTQLSATTYTFTMSETLANQEAMTSAVTISVTAAGSSADAATIASAINAAGLTNTSASYDSQNRLVITHRLGGDIRIDDTDGALGLIGYSAYDVTDKTGTLNLYDQPGTSGAGDYVATLWQPLVYTASANAPTALAADGALWYSSVVDEIDLMVHNGTKWVGMLHTDSQYYNADSTLAPDPEGPIVSATEPENGDRSDGGNLVTGDIWISTADLENYPGIYMWNAVLGSWVEIDKTDQTTENGVLFADARWADAGADSDAADIEDLLVSDYVDPDCPDPALYPKGMLLWNTRRSGFNVKRFERNHIDVTDDNERYGDQDMAAYYPHRWVTASTNNADGSGAFGRNAQRKVVINALQSLVSANQDIRDDETRTFNLIATPGYPELIGEMITLNFDRGLTAFVVGDSPMRLTPDATSLGNWASNVAVAVEDNDDGLVTSDEYLGVYYPSGYTSDNAGNNVVVPASHMVLRTFALNDQVAYPWFAPAGTRRGGVTNASSVGYINSEGEFTSTALNEGQRDILYSNNVNPVTFLNGAGLVIFGQKTRARNASALDRVNVARLVVYLRSQLSKLAKPYLFEPNDKITRDEIKQAVETLLVELVGLRALYDFLVVCDETNNTPARIDRNELYVDIAIEPVKAIEFIYIPLRIKNTGEIAGL